MARSPIRQRIVEEDGKLLNVWDQPSRKACLEENRERRKVNPRKSDWIRPMASIPQLDKEVLQKRRPELFQDHRQLEKFINSSDGAAYRTTPRGKARNFSFGGR